MFSFNSFHLLVALVVLVCMTGHVAAFGAGNIGSISKIEGQNWRHGDIEDALLVLSMAKALNGKKFNKLQISRVYFGNWLRDYSQAVDVGTVKNVSAEAIRLLLSILGFLTFGYGSGEFEVTADRLGCYRPEEHIDNPKDYADNVDARQYDRRLRGPVNDEVELAVDPRTGLKNYIANDTVGITTAIDHCRDLFKRCIQHGRAYRDGRNKADKYEALRLLGTGLHCLEDYFAHSNYIELALIEMGEDRIFPHVGRNTKLRIDDVDEEVYPIVTGTFGGVDFLHSVTGEVSDKLAQNELEELEGTLTDSKNKDTSLLRELLDKIPDGVFGGKHKSDEIDEIQANATAAQMQGTTVSPREPEEFARYIGQVFESIMPAIEFHDSILKGISTAIENIPILPKIIEQLEEQLSVWVFSIIAPTIVPIVQQLRSEMKTGSEEIISSSEQAQHIVFDDDDSSNPTHSMLSKDHFSNLLNEPAGRAASAMVKWVVPQLMDIMDSDDDPAEVIDYCILGVMAHPAQRNLGRSKVKEGRKLIYNVIKDWWNDLGDAQDQYRQFLSRNGVKEGRNHKTGVVDTGHGHGCSGNLHMHKQFANAAPTTMEDRIAGAAADAILEGATGAISGFVSQNTGGAVNLNTYKRQEEQESSSGSGFLSGLIGGIIGKASGRDDDEDKSNRYGSNNQSSYGGYRNDDDDDNRYGQTQSSYSRQESNHSRRNDDDNNRYESSYSRRNDDDNSYGHQESSYSRRTEESSYGSGGASADYYGSSRREEESSYGRQESSYGREERQESYGRQESSYGSGYGREERESYGDGYGGGYGSRDDGPGGYGGRDNGPGGYGGPGGFGGPGSFGGPGGPGGYGDESGYGGGRHHRRDDDDDRRGW